MRGSLEVHAIGRDAVSPCALRLKALPALDMMRYRRLSPDCLPLANGGGGGSGSVTRKPASRSCKDDDVSMAVASDSSRLSSYLPSSQLDSKPLRARAPQPSSSSAAWSPARDHAHDHHNHRIPSDSSDTASPSSNGAGTGGDVLLQWGHNKRSRCRRDSSAASSAIAATSSQQRRQTAGTASAAGKIQLRSTAPAEKLMLPPPPSITTGSYRRGSNLRSASSFPMRSAAAAGDAQPHRSAAEERSGGGHRRSPDKAQKSTLDAALHMDSKNHHHHHHDSSLTANGGTGAGEKLSSERFELPRIYISLSRKEKEDDFLAIKGTKLPQRPKKRAKNVDKTLQYVFPGMWLSDLTRGRYEVREKKCVKKLYWCGPGDASERSFYCSFLGKTHSRTLQSQLTTHQSDATCHNTEKKKS